jgi:hypothetical protein
MPLPTRILAAISTRPTRVADLPQLVGAPLEEVVPAVWRMCRDAVVRVEGGVVVRVSA